MFNKVNAAADLVTSSHQLLPEKLFQRIVIIYEYRATETLRKKYPGSHKNPAAAHFWFKRRKWSCSWHAALLGNRIMLVILFAKSHE